MDALLSPERGAQVVADLQARFDRLDVAYKTVNNTPIEAAILVPRTIASGTETKTGPVLAHFHGGGLLMGTNPEPFFLSDWVRDLAYSTPAIFVSPAYRLIPEAKATETLDDIADYWTWLHHYLPAAIRSRWPHLTPDLDRLAIVGESAGGYLALQTAFLFNATARARAVIAQYPAIYPDLAASNNNNNNSRPGEGAEVRAPDRNADLDAVIDSYLKTMAPGAVRTSSPWPERAQLLGAITQSAATWRVLLGPDPDGRLTLVSALAQAQAQQQLPPVWVIQGSEDSLVARAATDEVVARLREVRPDAVVKYTVRPGEHGFDALNKLEDDWVAEGVEFVKGYWLEV